VPSFCRLLDYLDLRGEEGILLASRCYKLRGMKAKLNRDQRNLTVGWNRAKCGLQLCLYTMQSCYYSPLNPLFLKIQYLCNVYRSSTTPREGWNSDSLPCVWVAQGDGLVFIGKVPDNTFGENVEGSTQ
jgi:hypothetical protein